MRGARAQSLHASHMHGSNCFGGNNPLFALEEYDQNMCPSCGREEYLAGRRRGCARCRGIVHEERQPVQLCAGCGIEMPAGGPKYHSQTCYHKAWRRSKGIAVDELHSRGVALNVDFLRALIKQRGYSSVAICDAIGVSDTWLANTLRRGSGGIKRVEMLASVLDIPLEELIA